MMCSSFTDGAAAAVLSATARPGVPRIRSSTIRSGNGDIDYHERMTETGAAAWDDAGIDPADVDVVELHDATSPEELYALESLGFYKPGDAGPATLAGETSIGGKGVTVNRWWSSPPSSGTRRGPARWRGPDWRWRPIPVA
jgi:acetyl-CoA acetyltransferase